MAPVALKAARENAVSAVPERPTDAIPQHAARGIHRRRHIGQWLGRITEELDERHPAAAARTASSSGTCSS